MNTCFGAPLTKMAAICGIVFIMEKTTIYLPGEIRRLVAAIAKREGRSQADIIRASLEAYCSERTPLRPRSIGAGADDEVTGANSEAWLRKNWKAKSTKKRKAGE